MTKTKKVSLTGLRFWCGLAAFLVVALLLLFRYLLRRWPLWSDVVSWLVGGGSFVLLVEYFLGLIRRERDRLKELSLEKREREVNFEQVFNLSPVVLMIVNSGGQITRVNRRVQDWLGYQPEELEGLDVAEIPFLSEKGKMKARILDQRVKGKRVEARELNFLTKGGAVKIGDLRVVPLPQVNDRRDDLLIISDVTASEEVDRAKTEFVAITSHQLLTPLTTIRWYAESLLKQEQHQDEERLREYLIQIYKTNQRMIGLVNTMLRVSRVEKEEIRFNLIEVSVQELIDSVLDELSILIQNKDIELVQKIEPVKGLRVDPEYFRIIVSNLLTNAVKYTPSRGRILIEVSPVEKKVIRGDTGVQEFTLTVEDNGCGIPPEQQKNVFTKLFRADNAREVDPEGTGLGLYIVKAIINSVGGQISFESEYNRGSRFTVRMPVDWTTSKFS